jgi:hypothetical protein
LAVIEKERWCDFSVLGAELQGVRVGEPHQKQEIQARTQTHTLFLFLFWQHADFAVFCRVEDPDTGGQK